MLGLLHLTSNYLVTFNMNEHFKTYLGNVGQVTFFLFVLGQVYLAHY